MWGSGVLVEVLGVDGQSFWNEMMRSRKSEEIRSDVEIVQCIWSPKRKGEKEKWWKQAQEKVCGGVLDWMLLKLIFASVCVCTHIHAHVWTHTAPDLSISILHWGVCEAASVPDKDASSLGYSEHESCLLRTPPPYLTFLFYPTPPPSISLSLPLSLSLHRYL